jgi:small-conductance mechanosensitive channel
LIWKALFDPRVHDWLVSLAILLGSYVAARLLSSLLGRLLLGVVKRTASTLDDRLLAALQRPLSYLLFLVGAYVAVHRLPIEARWTTPLDGALFVCSATLVTLALIRAYGIVLDWYATQSRIAASELAAEFTPLVSKVGKVFLVLVAAITVFQHFQINVASLVVSLGVGSLAVGLAAQDTLSNMFAGFTLLVDRPFRIGERIRLSTGETGDVLNIGIRATLIKTLEETILIVPNSILIKERLVNLSRPARNIAASAEVALPFGTDLEKAKDVLLKATSGAEHVTDEPRPAVLVQRFGDWAVHLTVGFHARDYASAALARSEVQERIYVALREAGIAIATAPRPA